MKFIWLCLVAILGRWTPASAFAPSNKLLVAVTRGSVAQKGLITMMSPLHDPPTGKRLFSLGKRKSTSVKASAIGLSSVAIPFGFFSRAQQRMSQTVGKIRRMDEVSMWRTAAATFISSLVLFHSSIDAALVRFWSYLQHSSALFPRMFRHDHWEWGLAVACFFVYLHSFLLADRAVAKAGREGRVHPWRKFRLQDRYEAQKLRRDLVRQKTMGREGVEVNQQPPLVTAQTGWNWRAWIFELPLYMTPLFIIDKLYPRRAAKLARWGPPTTWQICTDVTKALMLYDFFFFCGHILMHKIPFLYKTLHTKHHVNPECRAAEVVRLSLVEEVLEVGMSIVALNYLKCHPVARTIYNSIITFLLTELHCGFDFPWTPQNVVPGGFATGSRRHHYHHRFGRHYYQKFFCHVDRIFGFFQKDDGTLLGESVKPFQHIPESWVETSGKATNK